VTPHTSEPPYEAGQRAARRLADELAAHVTGIKVDPEVLADWLRRRWHIISPLAHTIHGAPARAPGNAAYESALSTGNKPQET